MDHTHPEASGNVHSHTLVAALDYRRTFKWPVFPVCSPNETGEWCNEHSRGLHDPDKIGKVPLVPWKVFQETLPTEVEVIAWWRQWPYANIGLATGKLANVVVVDLDGHVAQADAVRRGGFDDGPWARTGREGGMHRYFEYRFDGPTVFAKHGGIDFRGQGGYVVLPGSRHANGQLYEWGDEPVPAQIFPTLPRWVDALALEPSMGPAPALDVMWLLEHGVPEGMRDDILFRVASRLRGQNVDKDTAYDLVERIAAVCQPPFPVKEARTKVNSAYRHYEPNPDGPTIKMGKDRAIEDGDERVLYAVPSFPPKVLPPALRELATQTSLPTALVAGAGLGVLATAIGGATELVVDETQIERAIVWSALLGRNGVGKSPSMGLAYQPLLDRDAREYERYQDDLADWFGLDDAHRKREPKPQDPRLLRSDMSGSALVRQLNHLNDTGLKLDELSTTLRSMQSGKDGKSLLDPGQMLKLWSGEGVSQTRVGGGTKGGGNEIDLFCPRPSVALCGDLQTFLHPLLGSDGDGMRVRWLVHQHEEPWRQARVYPSRMTVQAWAHLVQRLVDRRRTARRWYVDTRERRQWDALVMDWQARAESAAQATYQAALLKADRQVLKLALILAEADADQVDHNEYITDDHLERAAAWVEYCLAVWLSLGDSERLSIGNAQQKLDPAVERVRLYIEQQGLVDAATGRRYATAKRLLNHSVAGIYDAQTRDQVVRRYAEFYPGCVEKRGGGEEGGRPTVILWAPKRRENGDFHPSKPPEPPVETSRQPVETYVSTGDDGVSTGAQNGQISRTGGRVGAIARERRAPVREKTPEQQARKDAEKAAKLLAKLEAADAAAPPLAYEYVSTNAALAHVLAGMDVSRLSLDTETTGLSAHRDKLRTIQFSDGQTHVVADGWTITDWSPLQLALNAADQVRMHTYLFDLAFLQTVDVEVQPDKILDVRTAAMVLESSEDWTDYRLQAIAKRHLHQHVNKAEQKQGWDEAHLRHAKRAYAAEDARVTWAAGEAVLAAIHADKDKQSLLDCLTLERGVQAATWWLASAGAPCDRDVMRQAIAEQEEVVSRAHAHLEDFAPGVLWSSWQQVLPVLQARGVDVTKTSVDALMDADSDDEIIPALLSYRSARTCLGLLRKTASAVCDDGRIYASFNPIGAQTGRTSCSDPNLQQLPHDTLARAAIRPGPGRVFVRADYSQLQLVIAAHIADDREMKRVLNDPRGRPYDDLHVATAETMGISRQQAKAINFGFLFGAGAETFRREQRKNGVILSLGQAKEYRMAFMRTYRGIRSWHRTLTDWDTEEVIFDPSGSGRRRRRVFSRNIKANTPVQMIEAHGFKRAMALLYQHRDEAPTARLVMMVHDELIAEVDEREAQHCAAWLTRHMETAMQPLVGDIVVHAGATIVADYSDQEKKRAEHA